MTVQEKLQIYRGKAYGLAVREAWFLYSEKIKKDCQVFIENQHVDVVCIYSLSVKYDLSFKITCEFMEELGVLSTGTYDDLRNRGLRIKDVKKMYDVLQNKTKTKP